MDGTLYLGDRLIDGAAQFLNAARRHGKKVLCLTNNSSRSAEQYQRKLAAFGLDVALSDILTSGDATASYLLEHFGPGARVYVAGTTALKEIFRQAGFKVVRTHPDAVVLGFDTTLTYASMSRLCTLVRSGLPYYATHPDYNCPTEHGPIPDTGAIIAFVKASTGRDPDAVIGKPNRLMVEAGARRLGLAPAALACVGDRLYTDIAMGVEAGIPAVLVLSGETQRADLEGSKWQPDLVIEHIGVLSAYLSATAHSHNGHGS